MLRCGGGGALLYILDAGFEVTAESLRSVRPWAWMATRWKEEDERRVQIRAGDPKGQARWEAYAAVCAFRRWAAPLLEARGGATVLGDALGVLLKMGVLRSKDPRINMLFMELALVLAPTGSSLECLHVCAEDNTLADELSRMKEGAREPPHLRAVARTAWHGSAPWWIV